MHRCFSIGSLALLAIVWAIHASMLRPEEPVYAGKRVTQWLEAGYEDCAKALQEIGPTAGPYVLTKLAREDPLYGRTRAYRGFWVRLPAPLKNLFPKPKPANFDQGRAVSSLLEIGPPVIPILSQRLKDANPAVRCACARSLALFRNQGTNIRAATTALTQALSDPNPQVSALAGLALDRDKPSLPCSKSN